MTSIDKTKRPGQPLPTTDRYLTRTGGNRHGLALSYHARQCGAKRASGHTTGGFAMWLFWTLLGGAVAAAILGCIKATIDTRRQGAVLNEALDRAVERRRERERRNND